MADFQKPKSDFDREMVILENEMRRLEAEFNMFFAGSSFFGGSGGGGAFLPSIGRPSSRLVI